MNFLRQFNPSPILFQWGEVAIYWYGFFLALALASGFLVVRYLGRRRGLAGESIDSLAVWAAAGGLIGARLYEVAINWFYYQKNLTAIWRVWEGGLAIHGALIGGGLAIYFWARKNKIDFWRLADLTVIGLALGQAIGRWGNYFNQELFGRPTSWPWGIPIAPANRPTGYELFEYFQPAFLYESILNLILFLILFILWRRQIKSGRLTLIYLAGYAAIRFLMEFIRIDPAAFWFGLRLAQWVSLAIFFGVAIIWFFWRPDRCQRKIN